MQSETISFEVKKFAYNDLDPEIINLIREAQEASQKSYSPYSKFSVGASLQLDDGRLFQGNNQENASYSCGMCAERVLINYIKAKFPNSNILRIAISAMKSNGITDTPVTPCGSCRQVMLEVANRQSTPIELLLCGKSIVYIIDDVRYLLPLQFDNSIMN